ncbi:MAG: aldo/keto reductase, partial [Alphaproteobacteria bacterium]|nr:aldo/keto reductase [Alphaproteobacteria bacterium]
FRLVTKTASIRNGVEAVVARARQSVSTLGRKPVDLLLVHAASDLLGPDGPELWRALLKLRDEGLFGGIGISCYVADDPVALARRFRPTAMQVPCSLLDQRLLQSGALAALKEMGVEIHVRSIFLQGLLFLPVDRLPTKLKHVGPRLAAIHNRISETGSTPLEAALAFALTRPEIDVAVVGVTALTEFEEIVSAALRPTPAIEWEASALDDETVLTPSRW